MYYIDVEDVDGLLAELKPKLDTLPDGHVHGPRDQPYGQRELMIVAPDGNLLVFGQSIFEKGSIVWVEEKRSSGVSITHPCR